MSSDQSTHNSDEACFGKKLLHCMPFMCVNIHGAALGLQSIQINDKTKDQKV
jgi:hypothetical protein